MLDISNRHAELQNIKNVYTNPPIPLSGYAPVADHLLGFSEDYPLFYEFVICLYFYFLLKCSLFLKINRFTLDKTNSIAEPKKKIDTKNILKNGTCFWKFLFTWKKSGHPKHKSFLVPTQSKNKQKFSSKKIQRD